MYPVKQTKAIDKITRTMPQARPGTPESPSYASSVKSHMNKSHDATSATWSSESRSQGLNFAAIHSEETDAAVATIALVERLLKKTRREVSHSRTRMRYTPYQYVCGSYFSKVCCMERTNGDGDLTFKAGPTPDRICVKLGR